MNLDEPFSPYPLHAPTHHNTPTHPKHTRGELEMVHKGSLVHRKVHFSWQAWLWDWLAPAGAPQCERHERHKWHAHGRAGSPPYRIGLMLRRIFLIPN
jgi:hypothetical protein